MIELRTTERTTFKACMKRWEWGVKEGLAKTRTATPLWFGTAVHIALAEWYLPGFERGPHPAATFKNVLEGDRSVRVRSDSEEQETEFMEARELGIAMLEHYVDFYGRDPKKFYICTERTGHIYLPRLGQTRGRDIKYFFTFDGVYRDTETGLIWLDEHKTAAGINTEKLALDEQASSYWAVCEGILRKEGLIGRDDHVEGIMFNFLRKKEPDLRPANYRGMRTNKPIKIHYVEQLAAAGIPIPTQFNAFESMKLDELAALARATGVKVLGEESKQQPLPHFVRHPVYRTPEERNMQLRRIQQDAWHIEKAWNDPGYPIIKSPGRDCGWCDFFQICQMDEQGDTESVEDMKQALYIVRDPYAAYRKTA